MENRDRHDPLPRTYRSLPTMIHAESLPTRQRKISSTRFLVETKRAWTFFSKEREREIPIIRRMISISGDGVTEPVVDTSFDFYDTRRDSRTRLSFITKTRSADFIFPHDEKRFIIQHFDDDDRNRLGKRWQPLRELFRL